MNTANGIKCIMSLCKAIKVIKCVKKIEIVMIAGVMLLVGIGTLSDNKKEIGKLVKQFKKKVM